MTPVLSGRETIIRQAFYFRSPGGADVPGRLWELEGKNCPENCLHVAAGVCVSVTVLLAPCLQLQVAKRNYVWSSGVGYVLGVVKILWMVLQILVVSLSTTDYSNVCHPPLMWEQSDHITALINRQTHPSTQSPPTSLLNSFQKSLQ